MKELKHIGILAILVLLFACEKEVEIDIPPQEEEIVIEGQIETGMPPIVLVSKTRGFFEPTSAEDLAESYIGDAEVYVNDIPLDPICTDNIPPEFHALAAELLGIELEDLDDISICGYIGLDTALIGMENTTYNLKVLAEGKTLTSTTHIPHRVAPDSVWFRLWADSPNLGYVFMNLTDPDTIDNAYRVFTKRSGPNVNNNPEDDIFYPPQQSAFIDEFFNGETIEVGFERGYPPNSSREVDLGDERGYFEVGDQFVLKFSTMDKPAYEFFRTYETQLGTAGSPFATPSNIITNIDGGLGIWVGYASTLDTVLATP